MDQLIPSLDSLLAPRAAAFGKHLFDLFRRMVSAWVPCPSDGLSDSHAESRKGIAALSAVGFAVIDPVRAYSS
jgi:hypothetical protein